MLNEFSLRDQFRSEEDFSEFEIFDGEDFIKFNIVELDEERKNVTVAVTNRGRISVITYDLVVESDRMYFEYGNPYSKVVLDDVRGDAEWRKGEDSETTQPAKEPSFEEAI